MRTWRRQLKGLARDRRGATAIEYGLILALVFLAILVSVRSVADVTISMWTDVQDRIVAATG